MGIILPVFLPVAGRLLPVVLLFPAVILPIFAVSGVTGPLPRLEVPGCILATGLTRGIPYLLARLQLRGGTLSTLLPLRSAPLPTAATGGATTRITTRTR